MGDGTPPHTLLSNDNCRNWLKRDVYFDSVQLERADVFLPTLKRVGQIAQFVCTWRKEKTHTLVKPPLRVMVVLVVYALQI
jgi:hypothetical protein